MTTNDKQAPGQGERRAQRGYVPQYDAAAAAIRAALSRDELIWVGLADRSAGIADDVVLGLADRVIGQCNDLIHTIPALNNDIGLSRPRMPEWLNESIGETVEDQEEQEEIRAGFE